MKSTIVYTVFIFAIYKFDYYVTRPLMGQVFKNRWILFVRDSGMWYILRALFYYLMSKLKTPLKQSPLILQLFRFEPPGNAQTTVWIVSVLKECVVHPKADQSGLKFSVVRNPYSKVYGLTLVDECIWCFSVLVYMHH